MTPQSSAISTVCNGAGKKRKHLSRDIKLENSGECLSIEWIQTDGGAESALSLSLKMRGSHRGPDMGYQQHVRFENCGVTRPLPLPPHGVLPWTGSRDKLTSGVSHVATSQERDERNARLAY